MIDTVSAPTCDCIDKAVRLRTYTNGQTAVVSQCTNCGRQLSTIKKSTVPNLNDLQPFDEELPVKWDRKWREWQTARRAALDEERRSRGSAWWLDYKEYLRSPEWRHKSQAVLTRDKHMCQAQLSGCKQHATMAHHLTYERLRREPLFDLVSVCDWCHNLLHPDESD